MSRALAVAALLLPAVAGAGNHQLCFQERPWSGRLYATVACHTDAPGIGCTIAPPAGWTEVLGIGGTSWRLGYYETGAVAAPVRATARIAFGDGTVRSCTTELLPSPRDVGALVGYTTDASGLVTTGVFSRTDPLSKVHDGRASAWSTAPAGFAAVGGGLVGAEAPVGTLLQALFPGDPPLAHWSGNTFEPLRQQDTRPTAYVIAMAVEGLSGDELTAMVAQEEWRLGAYGNVSLAWAPIRPGRALVSGGAIGRMGVGWPDPTPNLTATFPIVAPCPFLRGCSDRRPAIGWTVAVKGFEASYGQAIAIPVTLPERIVVGGVSYRVVTHVTSATSGLAAHPSVVVAGRLGDYALTGVGAQVDWTPYGTAGNYLWKLLPRPDVAGAEVASKDHAYPSPAVITGYAIGMKLERE